MVQEKGVALGAARVAQDISGAWIRKAAVFQMATMVLIAPGAIVEMSDAETPVREEYGVLFG